jgi:hypothetical protein
MIGLLTPRLFGFAGAFAAGALVSGLMVDGFKDGEIYRLKATAAQQQADAEAAIRQRLEAATLRGDQLATQLTHTESTLKQKTLETSREIARLTTGRRCLDAAAVRLLNAQPGDSAVTLPAASDNADAEAAPAASDSDIAGWIVTAQGQYETCRARLASLIDFVAGEQHE